MVHGCSYFDPDFVPLPDFIPHLRVYIDNETCYDCTLIKLVGANRRGILLKMVQILGDLDFIISKSYITSDGDWFMDVFHITDHHGQKLRDPTLIRYIQQSLNIAQKQNGSFGPTQVRINHGSVVSADHFSTDCMALEISSIDRPGIFSEVTAVLFKLSCAMDSGELWTHNGRAACIFYLKEHNTDQPIFDRAYLVYLGEYVANVVKAHHFPGEPWGVRLQGPAANRIHTQRRLHQMLQMYKDFDATPLPLSITDDQLSLATTIEVGGSEVICRPHVSVERWEERDYLAVNVRSMDRPKLMFDTVCALTDLGYDIFHGSVSSYGFVIVQEYFVRRTNGCTVIDETEKQSVVRSLAASVNRRMARGLKMEVRALDRHGLLLDISKTLRENSLSLEKIEFAKVDGLDAATIYVTDASSSADANDIDQQRLEAVCNEIGSGIFFEKNKDCSISSPTRGRCGLFSMFHSLGRCLWSHIKRLFNNFIFIR